MNANRVTAAAVWLLVAYLGLLAYGFGAAMLESFLNYPLWRDMGARMSDEAFMVTRQVHTWRIYLLLVLPLALRYPVTIALLWHRPAFVPRWAVLFALVAQTVGWLSSALIQIPIQVALTENGFSDDLFARLIETDLWLRALPFAAEVVVALVLVRGAASALPR